MFPGGTPFGFYNAPISKALLVVTGTASALNILLPVFKIQNFIAPDALAYIQHSKILSGLLRSVCYSSGKNMFFGSLLLYNFRIFEHRYGSQKFADYILASTFIGAGLQYAMMFMENMKIDEFPSGPFWMIFSCFVPFYLSIPSVNSTNFFGIVPSTGKIFTYIIGLQMLLNNQGAFLSGLSGLIAGGVYHFNVLSVQRWLTIPRVISRICSRIFGKLFESTPPNSAKKLQGATLEVQRQIRMDELDQQIWRLQEMNVTRRQPVIGNPIPGGFNSAPADVTQQPVQQPTTEVSEEQVQRLIEMGFTRYAVLQALTASNNNIATAMNILLSE